jgi:hypothetical protein
MIMMRHGFLIKQLKRRVFIFVFVSFFLIVSSVFAQSDRYEYDQTIDSISEDNSQTFPVPPLGTGNWIVTVECMDTSGITSHIDVLYNGSVLTSVSCSLFESFFGDRLPGYPAQKQNIPVSDGNTLQFRYEIDNLVGVGDLIPGGDSLPGLGDAKYGATFINVVAINRSSPTPDYTPTTPPTPTPDYTADACSPEEDLAAGEERDFVVPVGHIWQFYSRRGHTCIKRLRGNGNDVDFVAESDTCPRLPVFPSTAQYGSSTTNFTVTLRNTTLQDDVIGACELLDIRTPTATPTMTPTVEPTQEITGTYGNCVLKTDSYFDGAGQTIRAPRNDAWGDGYTAKIKQPACTWRRRDNMYDPLCQPDEWCDYGGISQNTRLTTIGYGCTSPKMEMWFCMPHSAGLVDPCPGGGQWLDLYRYTTWYQQTLPSLPGGEWLVGANVPVHDYYDTTMTEAYSDTYIILDPGTRLATRAYLAPPDPIVKICPLVDGATMTPTPTTTPTLSDPQKTATAGGATLTPTSTPTMAMSPTTTLTSTPHIYGTPEPSLSCAIRDTYIITPVQAVDNLLANGEFEGNDAWGWGNDAEQSVLWTHTADGSGSAKFYNDDGGSNAYISQHVDIVGNHTYDMSWWRKTGDLYPGPIEFRILVRELGTNTFVDSHTITYMPEDYGAGAGWIQDEWQFTVPAGISQINVQIKRMDDIMLSDIILDDITLSDRSASGRGMIYMYEGQEFEIVDMDRNNEYFPSVNIQLPNQQISRSPGIYVWNLPSGYYEFSNLSIEPAMVVVCQGANAESPTPQPGETPGVEAPTPSCDPCEYLPTMVAQGDIDIFIGLTQIALQKTIAAYPTLAPMTSTVMAQTPVAQTAIATPTLRIAETQYQVMEDDGQVVVTFLLDRPAAQDVSFHVRTLDLEAVAGGGGSHGPYYGQSLSDYVAIADMVVEIATGESLAQITIDIVDDVLIEPTERFLVEIVKNSVVGAVLGDDRAAISIIDDDTLVTPTRSSGIYTETGVCVAEIDTPVVNTSPMPDFSIRIPTLRPLEVITPTSVISVQMASLITMAQTLEAQIKTPAASVLSSTDSLSDERAQEYKLAVTRRITPVLSWIALLNPMHPAYEQEGTLLWGLAPILRPVVPFVGLTLVILFGRYFLWVLGWLMRLLQPK